MCMSRITTPHDMICTVKKKIADINLKHQRQYVEKFACGKFPLAGHYPHVVGPTPIRPMQVCNQHFHFEECPTKKIIQL